MTAQDLFDERIGDDTPAKWISLVLVAPELAQQIDLQSVLTR